MIMTDRDLFNMRVNSFSSRYAVGLDGRIPSFGWEVPKYYTGRELESEHKSKPY